MGQGTPVIAPPAPGEGAAQPRAHLRRRPTGPEGAEAAELQAAAVEAAVIAAAARRAAADPKRAADRILELTAQNEALRQRLSHGSHATSASELGSEAMARHWFEGHAGDEAGDAHAAPEARTASDLDAGRREEALAAVDVSAPSSAEAAPEAHLAETATWSEMMGDLPPTVNLSAPVPPTAPVPADEAAGSPPAQAAEVEGDDAKRNTQAAPEGDRLRALSFETDSDADSLAATGADVIDPMLPTLLGSAGCRKGEGVGTGEHLVGAGPSTSKVHEASHESLGHARKEAAPLPTDVATSSSGPHSARYALANVAYCVGLRAGLEHLSKCAGLQRSK
mmetsp:Transcript_71713/g.201194  ORF Transcript_71713/g.201194 Transcript_71713/m.201194 type:complete len:337 (+) Transcript_71713:91-1101(+)